MMDVARTDSMKLPMLPSLVDRNADRRPIARSLARRRFGGGASNGMGV